MSNFLHEETNNKDFQVSTELLGEFLEYAVRVNIIAKTCYVDGIGEIYKLSFNMYFSI